MIQTNQKSESQLQFEKLLQRTKGAVLEAVAHLEKPSTLTGAQFELLVFEQIENSAIGTEFEGKTYHTLDREFPDITVGGGFGIEVKATKKNDWRSIGNSVLESSRIDTITDMYMFFGKLGGTPEIKFRRYEDCLKGIAVTHYPRYTIDMNLTEDQSIFKKMDTHYDAIRSSENPVKTIRAYYKQFATKGESLWWIGDEIEDMTSSSPIIRNFSQIDPDEKESIKAEVFAFFPEIFSDSKKKYERIPAYLASQHGIISSGLRDNFSAGGQRVLQCNGQSFKVSKMVSDVCRLAPMIRATLDGLTSEQLSNYWAKKVESFTDAEHAWLSEVDIRTARLGLPIRFSDLYQAAIEDKLKAL